MAMCQDYLVRLTEAARGRKPSPPANYSEHPAVSGDWARIEAIAMTIEVI